ncbi:lipopolysaccharide biosynthesis protein [Tenacibaculum jejuense]|uniref:Polysaccharide biosynthesis protein n=1 Tax=Tenacibaculum jejuense TaxID=584609 RepID=A0A238U6S2_9FLAO|nr:lipopolysaccharide biosynthesis protein [Tenacibaculum jejuense]SNR14899.1 polysaccharide biosynthesis protein [Tenacibaculum jejuense]
MTKDKQSSVKMTLWSMLGRYIPQIIQIVSTLIIARLITPQDFGEVAIITTFTQIASLLVASGFSEALIFRVNNTQSLYSTVFYTNLSVSLLLYSILFLCADFIADFYEIKRLSILTKVVGLNVIVYSFTYIQRVLFSINLNFKFPALVTLVSSVLGAAVGLYLAYNDYGVWSIVFQTLSINLIQALLFWGLSNWKPNIIFSFEELKEILPYSFRILSNNFVQVFYDNVYSLVIGKVFSAKILGYYNRMQTVVFFTTTNFMYAVESVFFPILSKSKNDEDYLRGKYEILLRLSTFLAFPILIFIIALSKPLIVVILTEKWLGGAEILKLLSVAYLFIPLIYINNSYLKILDKTQVLLKINLLKKLIGITILLITMNYDIITVCYGIICYYTLDAVLSMYYTQKYLKVKIYKQISFILLNIFLNGLLFLLISYISSLFIDNFYKILFSIIIGIGLYLSVVFLLKSKEYFFLKKMITKS